MLKSLLIRFSNKMIENKISMLDGKVENEAGVLAEINFKCRT